MGFIENKIVIDDQTNRQKNKVDGFLESLSFIGYSLTKKNINIKVLRQFK